MAAIMAVIKSQFIDVKDFAIDLLEIGKDGTQFHIIKLNHLGNRAHFLLELMAISRLLILRLYG